MNNQQSTRANAINHQLLKTQSTINAWKHNQQFPITPGIKLFSKVADICDLLATFCRTQVPHKQIFFETSRNPKHLNLGHVRLRFWWLVDPPHPSGVTSVIELEGIERGHIQHGLGDPSPDITRFATPGLAWMNHFRHTFFDLFSSFWLPLGISVHYFSEYVFLVDFTFRILHAFRDPRSSNCYVLEQLPKVTISQQNWKSRWLLVPCGCPFAPFSFSSAIIFGLYFLDFYVNRSQHGLADSVHFAASRHGSLFTFGSPFGSFGHPSGLMLFAALGNFMDPSWFFVSSTSFISAPASAKHQQDTLVKNSPFQGQAGNLAEDKLRVILDNFWSFRRPGVRNHSKHVLLRHFWPLGWPGGRNWAKSCTDDAGHVPGDDPKRGGNTLHV